MTCMHQNYIVYKGVRSYPADNTILNNDKGSSYTEFRDYKVQVSFFPCPFSTKKQWKNMIIFFCSGDFLPKI